MDSGPQLELIMTRLCEVATAIVTAAIKAELAAWDLDVTGLRAASERLVELQGHYGEHYRLLLTADQARAGSETPAAG